MSKMKDHEVRYDFCGHIPIERVGSYRGYYEDFRIGWAVYSGAGVLSVGRLTSILRSHVGSIHSGYKGGDYRMTSDTPVWVSNYGEVSDTVICGVVHGSYCCVLETRWVA